MMTTMMTTTRMMMRCSPMMTAMATTSKTKTMSKAQDGSPPEAG